MERRALGVLVIVLVLSVVLGSALRAPASASAGPTTPLSRSAQVAYGGCPADDVVLTVTLPRRSFAPKELVTYGVTLHDRSRRACGPSEGAAPSRGPVMTLLGPCSEIPIEIENAQGLDVYPGPQAIACPALLGPRLRAHQTVSTTGTWDQVQGGGRPALRAAAVQPGTYHLVVDNTIRLTIVVQ